MPGACRVQRVPGGAVSNGEGRRFSSSFVGRKLCHLRYTRSFPLPLVPHVGPECAPKSPISYLPVIVCKSVPFVESNWPFSDVWRDSRENDRPRTVYPDVSRLPRRFHDEQRVATRNITCIGWETQGRPFILQLWIWRIAHQENRLVRTRIIKLLFFSLIVMLAIVTLLCVSICITSYLHYEPTSFSSGKKNIFLLLLLINSYSMINMILPKFGCIQEKNIVDCRLYKKIYLLDLNLQRYLEVYDWFVSRCIWRLRFLSFATWFAILSVYR